MLFLGWNICHSAHGATPEEVKTAYLYQFIKYIDWPKENAPQAELLVCVLGDPAIYRILSRKAGAAVGEKRLVVKQASRLEEIGTVHLLFIGSAFAQGATAVQAFNPRGVLTVGESDNFAKKGGMIGFVIPEDTVQFEINWEEAKARGIQISSKLLQLATAIVKTE